MASASQSPSHGLADSFGTVTIEDDNYQQELDDQRISDELGLVYNQDSSDDVSPSVFKSESSAGVSPSVSADSPSSPTTSMPPSSAHVSTYQSSSSDEQFVPRRLFSNSPNHPISASISGSISVSNSVVMVRNHGNEDRHAAPAVYVKNSMIPHRDIDTGRYVSNMPLSTISSKTTGMMGRTTAVYSNIEHAVDMAIGELEDTIRDIMNTPIDWFCDANLSNGHSHMYYGGAAVLTSKAAQLELDSLKILKNILQLTAKYRDTRKDAASFRLTAHLKETTNIINESSRDEQRALEAEFAMRKAALKRKRYL